MKIRTRTTVCTTFPPLQVAEHTARRSLWGKIHPQLSVPLAGCQPVTCSALRDWGERC